MVLRVKPSEIRYSQDSIKNTLSKGERLGQVLDNICHGSVQVSSFRWIRVAKLRGEWVTRDNRRLWLFRQLERLGKCGEIPVDVVDAIEDRKLTSRNGGVSIEMRGSPGGYWVHKPNAVGPTGTDAAYFCQFAETQGRSRSHVKQSIADSCFDADPWAAYEDDYDVDDDDFMDDDNDYFDTYPDEYEYDDDDFF